MGTLTGNIPRLNNTCLHKLPASCQLSSIGECCACYDERAHAPSYSTYVDGVGFVPWGTRWQRYCWFCKEYWENRVKASGLRPAQTRIPEVPDQSEFLDRWYEFHQGYRTVRKDDGTEERVAVSGEDFKDVSPGCLPRTLDELREGRERSALEEEMQRQQRVADMAEETPAGPSLEDTLDQMFQAAAAEEDQTPRTRAQPNIHAQAMVPAGIRNREYQARRVAALRRELLRMRNGIERVIQGLRELGEHVPQPTDASGALQNLRITIDGISGAPSEEAANNALRSLSTLTNSVGASQVDHPVDPMQARVNEARAHVNEARRMRDQAASEFDTAEQELQTSQQRLGQVQREQRTSENYLRLFGTREEMIAQGENYESPIGGMFTRAWDRFRAAEELRQETQTLRQVLDDEEHAGGEEQMRRLVELETQERDVWGAPRPPRMIQQQSTSNTTDLMEMARDEVFAGQALSHSPEHVQDGRSVDLQDSDANPGDSDETSDENSTNDSRHSLTGSPGDGFENVETMAQAFMRSAAVRRQSTLGPREQLQMLYRLQAGGRSPADRSTIEELLARPDTVRLAREALTSVQQLSERRREQADEERRRMAREGDHSRDELNAQRQAARNYDLAAGRTASNGISQSDYSVVAANQTGLLDRLAAHDEITRQVLEHMRTIPGNEALLADVLPRDLVEPPPESEDEEAQGLDAKDTGRPGPKTDEEMTVKLECRICFQQMADTVCLPCGHLVMCRYCSDMHSPTMAHDRTRPRRAAGCPLCRKTIRTKHFVRYC